MTMTECGLCFNGNASLLKPFCIFDLGIQRTDFYLVHGRNDLADLAQVFDVRLQKIGYSDCPYSSLLVDFLQNLVHLYGLLAWRMDKEQVYIVRIKVIE